MGAEEVEGRVIDLRDGVDRVDGVDGEGAEADADLQRRVALCMWCGEQFVGWDATATGALLDAWRQVGEHSVGCAEKGWRPWGT